MTKKTVNPKMPAVFFEWLDALLRQRELNDNQLAIKAGISNSVISKARTGLQPIGYEALAKIADALYVPRPTVWQLAGYDRPAAEATPARDEWVGLFDLLTPDDHAELLAIARLKADRAQAAQKKTARRRS